MEHGAGRAGGAQRAPAYYTHGRQVICTACAATVLDEGIAVSELQAHYFLGRPMLCGHCHIQIGPWSGDEISSVELVKCLALYSRDGKGPLLEQVVAQAREAADQ